MRIRRRDLRADRGRAVPLAGRTDSPRGCARHTGRLRARPRRRNPSSVVRRPRSDQRDRTLLSRTQPQVRRHPGSARVWRLFELLLDRVEPDLCDVVVAGRRRVQAVGANGSRRHTSQPVEEIHDDDVVASWRGAEWPRSTSAPFSRSGRSCPRDPAEAAWRAVRAHPSCAPCPPSPRAPVPPGSRHRLNCPWRSDSGSGHSRLRAIARRLACQRSALSRIAFCHHRPPVRRRRPR